jgi:hypothetical protein
MEGMNAPMGSYLNRGHTARAVTVVERSMTQAEPGVFTSQVLLPASGKFDVAFMLDQPQVLHCFSAEVKPGEATDAKLAAPRLEFLPSPLTVEAPSKQAVRFRLVQGRKNEPRTGATDLHVRYFLAAGGQRHEAPVTEVGDGVYEAQIDVREAGAYYVHVESAILQATKHVPYMTLRATAAVARK